MAKFYQSRASIEAKRVLKKIDRASVKAVSIVAAKIGRDGEIEAYDGIEAARQIRMMMGKIFADFSRNKTFRRLADEQ